MTVVGKRSPARAEVTLSGVPIWLLIEYLVELGGRRDGEDSVRGQGWTAKVARGKERVGVFGVGCATVTIEGVSADRTMAALRKKAFRGGG